MCVGGLMGLSLGGELNGDYRTVTVEPVAATQRVVALGRRQSRSCNGSC